MRSTRAVLRLAAVIAFVSLIASACGGSSSPAAPSIPTTGGGGGSPATADVTITIVGMNGDQSYSPNPGSVKVGQTVAWRNADSVTHTATANSGAFSTGNIAPGQTSAPIMMSTAGSFAYRCTIHPSMTGTLTVQ